MPDKLFNKLRLSGHTILSRIMLPGLAVMLVQSLFYTIIFWHFSVINHIEANAYDIFDEKVLNRKQDIQSDILHNCMRICNNDENVLQLIYYSLDKNHSDVEDISNNPQLNQEIILDISEYMVSILRSNMVNGAFLVLNGPTTDAINGIETPRAGIYLRNLDNTTSSPNNNDLLLERGMPALSRKLNISLGSCWEAGFAFEDKADQQSRFFFEPLNAAIKYQRGEGRDFGYWSESFSLSKNDIKVITYSVPLIAPDGTEFGVFGVEITEKQLASKMRYTNLSSDQNAAYFVGVSTDDGKTYRKVCTNGPLFKYNFGDADTINISKQVRENIFVIDNENSDLYGSIFPFELYNVNTPFYDQKWALIGMVNQDSLMEFSKKLHNVANISLVCSLILGICGIFFIGKIVTRPITLLVNDLKQSDPTKQIHLKKLNIDEIDELTVSIENLSHAVASSSEKIAKIFALTQISVGVFEYGQKLSHVFCSSNLCSILGWFEQPDENYIFLERSDFEKRMLSLSPYIFEKSEMIFQTSDNQGINRWMQINILEEKGKILGTISDVTNDILAKQKIEYERDYDSLTNLYNLRAFRSKISQMFHMQDLGVAALIMWDLDNLKKINDSFGHEFGDRYIRALSECLETCNKHNALVARRSGDEFYTMFYGYSSKTEIRKLIDELWKQIQQKRLLLPDGSEFQIDVSGGVAWYPDNTISSEELLRFADFAMYDVKHDIKGRIREFDPQLYHKTSFEHDDYNKITRLIDNEMVQFALQPIISVETCEVFGYEMLMRPQIEGAYTPYDVINMAQTHSKSYQIERISMFKGMHTFVSLVEQHIVGDYEKVFLNSIGNQILNCADLSMFEKSFSPYLHRIVLEITAGGQDNQDCAHMKTDLTNRWKAMLAIDDYGSGYNNESVLVYISPNLIKVNMSLIHNIDKDKKRQEILKSIVSNAKKHNIFILAEGIETEAELRTVVAHGVQYIQGFFISLPSFDIPPISEDVIQIITLAREDRQANL